jgi:hypothetical protein
VSISIFLARFFKSSLLNHSHPHLVVEKILLIYSKYFSHPDTFSIHLLASASIQAFLCAGRGKFLKI